jgi:hypothetical protein
MAKGDICRVGRSGVTGAMWNGNNDCFNVLVEKQHCSVAKYCTSTKPYIHIEYQKGLYIDSSEHSDWSYTHECGTTC